MAAGPASEAIPRRRPAALRRLARPSTATLVFVGILLVGAAARGVWVALTTHVPAGLHDPSVYLSAGDQISRGLGYRYIDGAGPTAYFPPGFPFALGAVFWLVRH